MKLECFGYFQHGNDPKHTVKSYLQKTNMSIIDWPVQNPDLNSTENLCDELKTNVYARR